MSFNQYPWNRLPSNFNPTDNFNANVPLQSVPMNSWNSPSQSFAFSTPFSSSSRPISYSTVSNTYGCNTPFPQNIVPGTASEMGAARCSAPPPEMYRNFPNQSMLAPSSATAEPVSYEELLHQYKLSQAEKKSGNDSQSTKHTSSNNKLGCCSSSGSTSNLTSGSKESRSKEYRSGDGYSDTGGRRRRHHEYEWSSHNRNEDSHHSSRSRPKHRHHDYSRRRTHHQYQVERRGEYHCEEKTPCPDVKSNRDRDSKSGSGDKYGYSRRNDRYFDDRYDSSKSSSSREKYSRESLATSSKSASCAKGSVEGSTLAYCDAEEVNYNEYEEETEDTTLWTRSSPADLYYQCTASPGIVKATDRLQKLHDRFENELVQRGPRIRDTKPKYEKPARKVSFCRKLHCNESSSESSDESSSDEEDDESNENALAEMELKKNHPDRLHKELWYNDPGEMNDGPLCRCSIKAARTGIRHSIYPGEGHLTSCHPLTNNANKLYHYRVTMSPHTNFVTKKPTIIKHDGHEFIFEGFSLFSHSKLRPDLPQCKVIRFNIEYSILHFEEKLPENFSIRGVELFSNYLFKEVLELVDLQLQAHNDPNGCPQFHIMPRFVRILEDNGKEILSMSQVLMYFLNSNKPLVQKTELDNLLKINNYDWQNFTDEIKGMIVTYPGMKPCSIRIDQLDRELEDPNVVTFPEIVHFGIRPPQLSYAGNPSYQRAWREYTKFKHLLANKPKVPAQDRYKLQQKEELLQKMRTKTNLKRDVTIAISSEGFYRTGVMCDIVQHALLIPVLICHLRFHQSLDLLENNINYCFKDRYLLQLALTHPSYRENFGTNPDHARNSLFNCGIRQPEYGDRKIHFMNSRKRGIGTLINIMSRFGQHEETASNINHNERLEFLGDAVVEFISSIHLFYMFPDLEEGGLATYRAAIVQNQHLALLAKHLELEKFMLFAHGSDLCHDSELRHAMANCFEALMGALFLDGGIEVADRIFSNTLFSDPTLRSIWVNYPQHVLQEQEPHGDRKWIESVPLLQKLTKFEDSIGVKFNHIRLLARSFTMRNLGYNHLTMGSNQRMEFLGDTVLQLIASEHLYKFFPEHHEGHLSLLRSSLVNNKTQSVVCEDIGMIEYAINSSSKLDLKTKDKADLLEAFLGALYVDQGLEHCEVFCQVCFFPRLQTFIMNQDWNDPKSKLQQCCLTLRSIDGGSPDIPLYKVIETKGPTNTRIYIVAVYFRSKRLAKGSGHSIQQAEMDAANNALTACEELFPQLVHQKRIIKKSLFSSKKH